MWIFLPTGHKFANRKEAKMVLGTSRFRKALENKEITWINE